MRAQSRERRSCEVQKIFEKLRLKKCKSLNQGYNDYEHG